MTNENFDIEKYIADTIKKEQERKHEKQKQIMFEIIRTKFSPYEIRDAFKTYNDFCLWIDKLEEEIKKDMRWYEI